MTAKQPTPTTIDAYITGFPAGTQAILQQLRATIKAAAPDAKETIKYQMPTVTLKGNLVYFAAWKKHIALYPFTPALEQFREDLAGYEIDKGTLRFPLDKPLPLDLIARMVKVRVAEDLAHHAASKKKEP